MSIINASDGAGSRLHLAIDIPAGRTVIAAVIEWRGKIALLKRRRSLVHDSGLWHCITGFLEAGVTPKQQALDELFEETGLQAEDLLDLRHGPDLVLADGAGNPWRVHTFTVSTSQRRLRMDWEHESYRWTSASKVRRFSNRVSWLDDVLTATGHLTALGPPVSIADQPTAGAGAQR